MDLTKVKVLTLVLLTVVFLGGAFSAATSYLYVTFSVDNFVGIEFRSYLDVYNHLFGNIGVNYLKGGVRFSSKNMSGLYISPVAFVDYKGGTFFGLFVGWSTVIQNLNNFVFFIEGGATKIPQKPEAFVNLGLLLRF